jgi:hypothetical protein
MGLALSNPTLKQERKTWATRIERKQLFACLAIATLLLLQGYRSTGFIHEVQEKIEIKTGTLLPTIASTVSLPILMREKVAQLTKKLEEDTKLRFFIYNDTAIERPDIKEDVMADRGKRKLLNRWGGFAKSEIHMLEKFKTHPLRTYDPLHADLYIIPLSISSFLTSRKKAVFDSAFGALYNTSTFQSTMGHRHILLVQLSGVFRRPKASQLREGLAKHYPHLWNVTVGKMDDQEGCHEYFTSKNSSRSNAAGDFHNYLGLVGHYMSRSGFSLGFIPPDNEVPVLPASYDKFRNATVDIFYRTRRGPSVNNSTQFRHALVTNETIAALPGSSIGFDVPEEQWQREYPDSKFCYIIRGDNPTSRALNRAVSVGCIPIIVSDVLEAYSPTLKSSAILSDYAVMVDEETFLRDPLAATKQVLNMPAEEIQSKLVASAFAQRVILPTHPESLFVPAVLHEANEARKRGLSVTSYPRRH